MVKIKIYIKTSLSFNPVYSAIKGGLLSFIKNLASFYGIYNIRANSIVCGGIEGHIAGQSRKQSRNFIKKYSTNTLLNRMGKPKDVASAVVFSLLKIHLTLLAQACCRRWIYCHLK